MAFCPNCGKPVTEQASKCLACGQEFEPRAKAARFKGTMMMTPASAPQAAAAQSPPPAAKPAAPAAVQQPPPAAAPAARTATPGPSKVAKVTMLGTGGMGIAPQLAPPGPATAAAPQAPPPAAGTAQPPASSSASAKADSPAAALSEPPAPSTRETPGDVGARPAATSNQREDSQRFLAGDPMAPSPTGQRARRMTPQPGGSMYSAHRAGVMVAVGLIGMLVIAGVGYFAARFMGLIQ